MSGSIDLREAGRRHLALCAELTAGPIGLDELVAEAARRIPAAAVCRADDDAERASELLYAQVEAALDGDSGAHVIGYAFNCSIFIVAIDLSLEGPLRAMAGNNAATNLQSLLMTALQDGPVEFVSGAGGDLLDHLGQLLDDAYYRVVVRGLRAMVALRLADEATSAYETLVCAAELEAARIEAKDLLPVAHAQCASDNARTGTLRQFERILTAKHGEAP